MARGARSVKAWLALALLTFALVFALALAAGEPRAGGPSAPPAGPHVDYCPTPAQVEAHWRATGEDYKPRRACTREGAVQPPAKPVARKPETNAEACRNDKALLRSAKPLPDRDGRPETVEGELPDGRTVLVHIMGKVKSGRTIDDEAESLPC
jgi:hypothetical protein